MQAVPHQLTQNVKVLQKVVLVRQNTFLILRRSPNSATRADLWDLPGGNSEWPESTENIRDPHLADVVREVEEETGIELKTEDFVKPVFLGSFFDAKKQIYTVILGWKVVLPDDFVETAVALSSEHYEFTWLSPEDIEEFDFGFAGGKDGFIRMMVQASF